MGQYIYCVIKNAHCSHPAGRVLNLIAGINNQIPRLINFRDMAAVASDTPLINFDRLKKEALLQNVAVHQRVNEAVMKDCDVIPLAFGTIAKNEEEVKQTLSKAYLQFKTALEKIAGKVEFAVQAFWDEKTFLEELAKTNFEIQKLKQKAETGRKIFSLAPKIKLGKLVFEAVESQREDYIKDIQDFLKECSLETAFSKLVDKSMIMNTSFLIEKDREKELDEKMNALGEKYDGKLRFKYVGPMPPYSFCNINLKLGNFEFVDDARKTLGLGREVTFPEIKKRYLELASQYHPDRCKNPQGQDKFKKVSEAFQVLENYCRYFKIDFNEKDENFLYSFQEEDIKNSITVQ